MPRWALLAAIILLTTTATLVDAQPVATPGARVRVFRPSGKVLQVGILERLAPDSVVLRDAQGRVWVLPFGVTQRLDVSAGKHRRVLPGMLIGGASGALGGLLVETALDQAADSRHDQECVRGPNGECAWGNRWFDGIEIGIGAAVGAGLGVVVGGVIGAKPYERWVTATLPLGAQISAAATGRGITVHMPFGSGPR